ncbi:NahK/ErcS family hybrid sensor histidine kinase/response regulator [Motiliproteus sp. SC1-56]|uniref:PAS domain-containing hybrid sensor histidine kinase/response regulator n=1 Tax=Motiliproteus sp. SC1-56 TaxID=2799565 RepID=UPI001F5D5034|nr:NahK/ErcS family hybrid sensor histidine kinase/response regulator [Motiliproteus sp. SC1-56]
MSKIRELEQEKERYEWLFENALHGIFQARIDGPVTEANPAIARICGYDSVAQFQQIRHIGEQLFYPDDYRNLLKLLTRDGQKVGFETQLQTRDGSSVSISTNVLLKNREQGLIEAFVQDITARKQAEAELNQLNIQLEQRVEERTRELSEVNRHLRLEIKERAKIEAALQMAKQDAEAANASKDKYLAAASHDLLQPLNAARLLISALQGKPLAPENRRLVERTHVALEGAEALLTDLLDIAKLDANAVTAELSAFNAADLISALASEAEPLAYKAGLRFAAIPSRTTVISDSRLLARILRNFISNAIRYTEHGRILFGCRRRGDHLEFQVLDTGPGIPKEQRQEIFREFHQLNPGQGNARSAASRDKGVGLGLAIVERIALMLEHPIEVRSTPGRGSCFSIRVPISRKFAGNLLSQPAPMAVGAELSGVSVLVIENEETIRMGMAALLEQWGCVVKGVESAQQAQTAFTEAPPDIILADYHLDQGQTGVEVIEELNRRHSPHAPPAIMITADRSDELRMLFKSRGLFCLNKPVKPAKLRALMSHALHLADSGG